MLLTIDIGNTNISFGIYHGDELGPRWRVSTDHDRMPDEYGLQMLGLLAHQNVSPEQLTGACMASVVPPLTGTLTQACQGYLGLSPLVVDAGVKTGVRIKYETPRSVGADRIVDAAAVHQIYGGPACVVDFGTGTTFDAISKQGDYLGGAIAPLGDWKKHPPCHAVRTALWLCGPGGRHGRAVQGRVRAGDEGDRNGRIDGHYRQRNQGD